MRSLVLIPDAYGALGGIAKFNRDLLAALAVHPDCEEVVALPRQAPIAYDAPPPVRWQTNGANGKIAYVAALTAMLARDRRFDLVVCGHSHPAPLAWFGRQATGAPAVAVLHGIEAWQPTGRAMADWALARMDHYAIVSELTR